MNALAALLALAAACLTALLVAELRPQPGPDTAAPDTAASNPAAAPRPIAATPPQALDPTLASTLLARPLFSQTRRPPDAASPAAVRSAATPLPRMTAILIDGRNRSAIFATPTGRPTIVAEGGRIGAFTIQTIEPQQVTIIGPEGKRTVRTSFDPALIPPAAPQIFGLGAPQFPGIAPFPAPGLPQPAGAAR